MTIKQVILEQDSELLKMRLEANRILEVRLLKVGEKLEEMLDDSIESKNIITELLDIADGLTRF